MKIGLVLDDTLDTPDGVQQYVLQIGRWLSEQDHEVHYLVGKTNRTDLANIHSLSRNLAVRFNGNRMSMPLPTSHRTLRLFLAREQFDILHVQVPYSPFMAGRLLRVAPARTAVIGTFHILPYTRLVTVANRFLAVLNRRSGRRFDEMLAVSEPAAQFARRVYGYEATVIPNPVRLEQFQAAHSDTMETTIVFLGRLVPRKGALLLLQAVAKVHRERLVDARFRLIIGGKGEQREELERFVRVHHLTDVVSFHGFVDEVGKADFLAQADIAVFPSTGGESFGIVLLEAMAAARGVVLAGDNPGYASVIPDPAQLVRPFDTDSFATQLAAWLNDGTKRKQAAALQHAYVKQFDVSTVGRRLLAVYDKALQSRSQT